VTAEWAGQIPPTGRVNAPEFLTTLYPGEKVALACLAEGPDRDKLLSGVRICVRLSSSKTGVVELRDLKPAAIRQIKAEGADMAMLVLNAGGIAQKDRSEIEEATSLVTLAVFQTDWTPPDAGQAEEMQITATISGAPTTTTIEPATIKIRPTADWLKDALPSKEEMGKYLNRYHEDMSPGRLLLLLKAAANYGDLNVPSVYGFFATTYQQNLTARNAAVAVFPSLDEPTQKALMFVLRLGGQDVLALLPQCRPENVAALNKAVPPLGDPRSLPHFKDPVSPDAVRGIGEIMDRCWSGWMATGDPSYLRALVGLLDGAEDFPSLQSWVKAKGGVKGLNAQVARGLAYQIAGWSVGSFQRTDPLISDWLLFWEHDPAFPPGLRKEIASLAGNPAFQRK